MCRHPTVDTIEVMKQVLLYIVLNIILSAYDDMQENFLCMFQRGE